MSSHKTKATVVHKPVFEHAHVQGNKMRYHPPIDSIRGQIRDHTGAPVTAASVTIQGSSYGVATDTAGRFVLAVPTDFAREPITLVISGIGYQQKEVHVFAGDGECVITMEQADAILTGEVVVVGGAFVKRSWWEKIKGKVFFWR